MITEEKLMVLEVQGLKAGFNEDCDFKDLIRLARLGLWANEDGIRKLRQIKKRFDDEDKGGMPSPERGPGMAWAMWTDAAEALAALPEGGK